MTAYVRFHFIGSAIDLLGSQNYYLIASVAATPFNGKTAQPPDGPFLSLGVFAFEAGEGLRAEIGTAGTDGYVAADAIQLITAE